MEKLKNLEIQFYVKLLKNQKNKKMKNIYNVMEKNKNRKIKNKLENRMLWNVDVKKIKKIEKLKN